MKRNEKKFTNALNYVYYIDNDDCFFEFCHWRTNTWDMLSLIYIIFTNSLALD